MSAAHDRPHDLPHDVPSTKETGLQPVLRQSQTRALVHRNSAQPQLTVHVGRAQVQVFIRSSLQSMKQRCGSGWEPRPLRQSQTRRAHLHQHRVC